MTPVHLYQWPDRAYVGRRINKDKLIGAKKPSPTVRSLFKDQVEKVTWQYKLASETVGLPSGDEIVEFQVFEIQVKSDDVRDDVLRQIDATVKSPVLFEVTRMESAAGERRMAASVSGQRSQSTSKARYYSTPWLADDTARVRLPSAVSLDALYRELLNPLLPVDVRGGEGMSDLGVRLTSIDKLERELGSLRKKMRTEVQFNRKIELRRQIKFLEAELTELSS